ncbi:MAG: alpha/beta family hydrolase [Alphaproteobacteria bacterium]
MTRIERYEADGVRGVLHAPAGAGGPGLVLTHGAGSDCRAPLLLEAASAFAAAGMAVLRCDLPFRQRRPKGPPAPAGAADDRDGLRRAVAAMRAIVSGAVFLGGHSYGGRQASILAADEPGLAAALLLLSYPLHPPKKPAQLRTAHLPRLATRCVFVHGTRDAFGTIGELEAALALIPAETRLVRVEGAGHDLRRGRFDWAPAIAALAAPGPRPRR